MASGDILAQITVNRQQEEALEKEIELLREKTENQQLAIEAYAGKKSGLLNEMQTRSTKLVSAAGHNPVAVFSVRLDEKKEASFSHRKQTETEQRAEELQEAMQQEQKRRLEELAAKESSLQSLRAGITQLEGEYQSALAQEEAERQAAAAAAAQAAQAAARAPRR